jgi:glycosyltransferase involved in cell wall biosynthesis
MRILYLSQYFPPEAGATQTRAFEMGRNLVRMGHSVTMIGEVPNHPSGIIPKEYQGKLYERSELEGMDVIRVWVKASPVKNFRNRVLFYISYMINATLAGLLLARGRYDLLIASSPPLFVGGAALILSALRRIPFVFEVRDLWPESAIALGELTNPRAIALATWLEEKCYQKSRKIIVVTNGIQERLLERGIPSAKIAVVPNGANVDLFQFSLPARQQVRNQLGLGDKFVPVYAGIHGIAQGLEIVVEAARLLQGEPDVHFVLIGDGPQKAEIARLVRSYGLENISLLPELPREAIPGHLSAADIALIPLRKLELFKGALPSKLFDAWACERPVLLSVDGEARQILESANGGVFVPPEDVRALANAILELKRDPDKRESMGKRGRLFTERHYSRETLAYRLFEVISS